MRLELNQKSIALHFTFMPNLIQYSYIHQNESAQPIWRLFPINPACQSRKKGTVGPAPGLRLSWTVQVDQETPRCRRWRWPLHRHISHCLKTDVVTDNWYRLQMDTDKQTPAPGPAEMMMEEICQTLLHCYNHNNVFGRDGLYWLSWNTQRLTK